MQTWPCDRASFTPSWLCNLGRWSMRFALLVSTCSISACSHPFSRSCLSVAELKPPVLDPGAVTDPKWKSSTAARLTLLFTRHGVRSTVGDSLGARTSFTRRGSENRIHCVGIGGAGMSGMATTRDGIASVFRDLAQISAAVTSFRAVAVCHLRRVLPDDQEASGSRVSGQTQATEATGRYQRHSYLAEKLLRASESHRTTSTSRTGSRSSQAALFRLPWLAHYLGRAHLPSRAPRPWIRRHPQKLRRHLPVRALKTDVDQNGAV